MKPIISVFSSTIRPQNWLPLYKCLNTASVPFEIIFVGPIEPDFTMPDNMKYICTDVKPAQCWYIGAESATGKYIINISDDFVFGDCALDYLVGMAEHPGIDMDKTIITPTYCNHPTAPKPWDHRDMQFFLRDKSTPFLPVCSLTTKTLFNKYGIDKNFYGLYWDLDFAMMNYENGGGIRRCKAAVCCDDPHEILCKAHGIHDRSFFYSMWIKKWRGNDNLSKRLKKAAKSSKALGSWIRKTRSRPVAPLVMSDDILAISQGVTLENMV